MAQLITEKALLSLFRKKKERKGKRKGKRRKE